MPPAPRHLLVALALITGAAACGGDEPEAASATVAATAAPTIVATTTSAPTTTSTTTTTAAPTTSTTTTTAAPPRQRTVPIDPPLDADATEPVIEMGRLAIPRLDVEMTMYEGIRMPTLDYGPGHWPGSALPGEFGNVVVAGHRTSKHHVFRDVDQLVPGDEIVFDDASGRHVYVVERLQIVEPDALWIVDPTDAYTATLFACHPPGSTKQRIVVFAELQGEPADG